MDVSQAFDIYAPAANPMSLFAEKEMTHQQNTLAGQKGRGRRPTKVAIKYTHKMKSCCGFAVDFRFVPICCAACRRPTTCCETNQQQIEVNAV